MLPLQFGIPGGLELLTVVLLLFLLGGLMLLVVLLSVRRDGGGCDRIAELERRVEELEEQLREERSG